MSIFMLELVIISRSPRSTPSLMIDAVNVGIYNVPATLSKDNIDIVIMGTRKGFI